MGTPHNNAVLPIQGEFDVPNLLPMTAARSMSGMKGDGLRIALLLSSYYEQIAVAVGHFASQGSTTPCVVYLDTDFGVEILEGAEAGAAAAGLEIAATAAHQPGDRDYVGSLSKLAGAGCDAIYLGVNFPEAISIKATAAGMGLPMPIIGSTAIFEEAVILLGAQAGVLQGLEGLYAATWIGMNDKAELNPVADQAAAFEVAFKQVTGAPIVTGAALLGHSAAMVTTAALMAAGPDLTAAAAAWSNAVQNIFTGDMMSFGEVSVRVQPLFT